MTIVKTDTPMTYEQSQAAIRALAEAYPFLRAQVLTTSFYGREVQALTLGTGPRQVIFSAGHHANEWLTATVLLKFMEDLAQAIQAGGAFQGAPAAELAAAVTIHAVPMMDPDGVDLVTGVIRPGTPQYQAAERLAAHYPAIPFPEGWKADLLGVDLNLQYPAGWLRAREIKYVQGYTQPGPRDFVGRAPLTQREARALADYTMDLDPDLVLALHSQGREIYWQFGDFTVPGAEELGQKMAAVSGYALAAPAESSSYAGYKDWFIQYFRRPGYTVEVGSGTNPLPLGQFPEIYAAVAPLLAVAARG